jgi:hypothetical protein
VHLNPARAKLIGVNEPLSSHRWSSYPAYLGAERAPWLRVDRVLGEFGIPGDTRADRRRFEEVMERRRLEADGEDYKGPERGWCFGAEEFRQELLAQVHGRIGPNHYGQERRESVEEQARRIVAQTLSDLGLSAAQWEMLPANAVVKVQLARRLRRETTLSLKWIADRLGVASWKYLSNLLGQETPNPAQPELGLWAMVMGVSISVVTWRTEPFMLDRRTLPGETERGVRREINGLLRRNRLAAAYVDDKLPPCPPLETDVNLPLVSRFLRSVRQRKPAGVRFFCDASVLGHGGIPSVVFGPGDIARGHRAGAHSRRMDFPRGPGTR